MIVIGTDTHKRTHALSGRRLSGLARKFFDDSKSVNAG